MPTVKVNFRGDATQLKQVSDRVKKDVGGMATSVKNMLGAAFAGVGAASAISGIQNLADEFSRIFDLSNRLGTDAETMQKLGRLASLAGADVETLARALTKVKAALGGTDAAGDKARATLQALGIDAQAFAAAQLDQQVYMLADAYKKTGGEGKGFSDILDLMGMKAADLIPLFKEGGAALKEMGDNMKIVSNEDVARIEELNDQWEDMVNNIKAVTLEFVLLGKAMAQEAGKGNVFSWWDNLVEQEEAEKAAREARHHPSPEFAASMEPPQTWEGYMADKATSQAAAQAEAARAAYVEEINTMGLGLAEQWQKDRAKLLKELEATKYMSTKEDFDALIPSAEPKGKKKESPAEDIIPETTPRPESLISDLARQGGAAGLTGGLTGDMLGVQRESRDLLRRIEKNTTPAQTTGSPTWV